MSAPQPTPPPERPRVTMQNVRIHDDLWRAAKALAEARGETMPEVIERALVEYVSGQRENTTSAHVTM